MTLTSVFEKQVFVRLAEDHAGFICTTKWSLLSKIRWVRVDRIGTVPESPNGPVREADSGVVVRVSSRRNAVEFRKGRI